VRLSAGPCHTGIQISRHLRIGRFGHDLLHQPLHVGDLRRVALPREQIGRDREIAELREAPAQIPNVLVQAEDLVHDQQHRQLALWFGARGPVGRNVTRGGRNRYRGRLEPLGVGSERRLCDG
jgi:hypothetical protein